MYIYIYIYIGMYPLHRCSYDGHDEMVEVLLNNGFQIDEQDAQNDTGGLLFFFFKDYYINNL